jgi:hypothetical protein
MMHQGEERERGRGWGRECMLCYARGLHDIFTKGIYYAQRSHGGSKNI